MPVNVPSRPTVTCSDYRSGRRLLALKNELNRKDLTPDKRREIEKEVADLERMLGMD